MSEGAVTGVRPVVTGGACASAARRCNHRSGPRTGIHVETMILVVLVLLLLGGLMTSRRPAAPDIPTMRVRAEAGETLWTLASAYPVQGLSTDETAELIGRMNHSRSSALLQGAVVRVPAVPAESGTLALR